MNNKQSTIILGIDPGFGRVGWGVIKKEKGKIIPIAYGCIETHKSKEFPDRLIQIEEELFDILKEYRPTIVGVETLYFSKNVTTAIDVSHARGIILLVCKKYGCYLIDINPSQVKQSLTGYGKADKKQMQEMIKLQLRLPEVPQPDDAADALAIAITAATMHRSTMQ